MTFYAWLRDQRERDDAVGDLARDALRDTRWPTRKSNTISLETYLLERGASARVLVAIDTARSEWQRARGY